MAAETFEEQQGSGFWLALEQRHGPNLMIEVSERCWRKHRSLGGGSQYGETEVEASWEIFK